MLLFIVALFSDSLNKQVLLFSFPDIFIYFCYLVRGFLCSTIHSSHFANGCSQNNMAPVTMCLFLDKIVSENMAVYPMKTKQYIALYRSSAAFLLKECPIRIKTCQATYLYCLVCCTLSDMTAVLL